MQQALDILIMATAQDQEEEHHKRLDHGSRENRSSHCDDDAWGPQGAAEYRGVSGKRIIDTLVMVPAYNDSSGRPDLRHGRMHLRRALLTIEMESLDMNHCGDTHFGTDPRAP